MHNFQPKILYKSIFISFFFIFAQTSLFAQVQPSLDEDFLSSLPEGVQEELANENSEESDPLDKLLNAKTSVLKNKAALQIIKQQITDLENRILDESELNSASTLPRFGESFFSSTQSTFMPINVPNLDGGYVLGVGDKFSLNIVGNNSSFDEYVIGRDGSISIEEYGKVFIAGQEFSDAKKIITNFIKSKLIGGEIYISLKELRDIQVVILGSTINPGIYTMSGGSNILHALNVSGGIGKNGSFRKIRVMRAGQEVQNIDLYKTFVFGNSNLFNFNLRSGDSIFIEPLEFSVPISGGVNNPAVYDISPGETLEDLLAFAGGFSQNSFSIDSVTLQRDGNQSSQTLIINKDNLKSVKLQPQDSILVPEYSKAIMPSRMVTISGAIKRPGQYSIDEDETLLDLVSRAGGYKKNVYEYGGIFYRKSIEDVSTTFSKRIYSDTINFLVSNLGQGSGGGNPITGDFMKILIEEFQSSTPIKRVITEFDIEKLRSNPLKNLRLEDGDVIEIPDVPQHVFLFGDFNQQVILPYNPNLQIEDYIALAAGKKSSATEHLILIDPNGLSSYFEKPRFALFKENPDIYPGSIIYLPRELGKVEGVMFAAAVAPILSSLTLSLASINAINSN
ncbi:SLBB domain-containing protein [Gammaproteobacteria bacterium]|nr:SLBB domain-containing protein [Gammaproteobacteria bacterium]